MKSHLVILVSVFAGIVIAQGARSAQGQELLQPGAPIESTGIAASADAPDSSAYADGVRAVNQNRWSDAISIFTRVADQGGQHADGALYWKAYALNKLGQTSPALEGCDKLRREHPVSSWIEDCGALEIEIHAKAGQPVQPRHEESDDLKLLALANLMQHNEKRALAEIEEILNSNASEKLKQGAISIMGKHYSDATHPQITAGIDAFQPGHGESDDLKLAALANLMQHNEKRALAEIDQILNSNSSERLKQGAISIMGQHYSSDTFYPEIARISLMQGDVRVMRGESKDRGKGATWEQVATGLPLESGFSLVTGSDGRAEIELENASTLYLGENSVLAINDMHTTAGVPHTELALLSGTATLHIRPYVAGEIFILRTPTDNLETEYPNVTNFRVSSYADGIGITPAGKEVGIGVIGSNRIAVDSGQTRYFKAGRPIMDAGPISPPDFSAWDKWVADRFAERTAAMNTLAKAAGLDAPLPGLADLQGKGNFFPCEPYGTCWEPSFPPQQTTDASPRPSQPGQPDQASALVSDSTPAKTDASASTARKIGFIGTPSPSVSPRQSPMDAVFPCMMGVFEPASLHRNGQNQLPFDTYTAPPWAWTECHAGGWIYQGSQYVWVVGRRHHHPPVHWVKYGNQLAYVPVHPHDVKNRPPVNLKSAIFAVDSKNPRAINKIESPTAYPIATLKEAPREFRDMPMPVLPRAAEPRMTVHQIRDLTVTTKMGAKSAGTPITFDLKSQSFMVARQEMHGGHSMTVNAPINNPGGNLQSHAGGFGGGAGGSHGGGSSAGSHGGGGSAAGGNGSSSASASSSSSSSGASTSSSGGGSHK